MGELNHGEVSRDQQSEVVLRFLERAKNINALHGAEVKDVFSNPENIRDFLDSLEEVDFMDLLNGINGLLRGKDKSDWKMDGGEVMLEGFVESDYPPQEQDKPGLLHDLYVATQEMNEEQRSLEDIGVLLSSGINAVHAYADANGRTSRFVYALINQGYNEQMKDELRKLMGEDGREVLDVNPAIVDRYLTGVLEAELSVSDQKATSDQVTNIFFEGPTTALNFPEGVPDTDQSFIRQMLRGDERFMFYVFREYLQTVPGPEQYVSAFQTHSSIRVDLLMPTMAPEAIRGMIDRYWALKKHRVELLMDSIQHPEKLEYQIDVDGTNTSILEYLKSRIRPKSSV